MSGAYTYPGVYIQELASPVHTINGVQTSVTAFVGAAARGAVNTPVSIASPAEYGRNFGAGGSLPLDLAVSLFYQNGGGAAFVVRVAPSALASAAPPAGKFPAEIRAISPGAWGDGLAIAIDQANLSAAQAGSLYNLSVTDAASGASERYVGISTDPASPRSLQRTLLVSNLLTAVAPAAPGAAPAAGAVPAAGAAGAAAGAGAAPAAAAPLIATGTFTLQGGDAGAQQPAEADLLGDPAKQTGLYALSKNNIFFNLIVMTPVAGALDVAPTTLAAAASFAQNNKAILIADAPSGWATVPLAVAGRDAFYNPFGDAKTNAAVYFPRVEIADPAGGAISNFGPSAVIAGLYAATDASRGVWKAPAGIAVQLGGVTDLSVVMADSDNGQLNPVAVNCLRTLPVVGNVVWGARTMAGDDVSGSQWQYIPIRRLALFIEASLYQGTQWVVFEPNDEPLWAAVRLNVGAFMQTLFRRGAFAGSTAKEAYFVKCDSDTNPPSQVELGILNVIVGFAPLYPAEFVVISIQQITPDSF